MEPVLHNGGLAVDDRGAVGFVNGFDFAGVKRFYTVRNHRGGFVRAWHAHRREAKYVTAVSGAALVGAVCIDDWEKPSASLPVVRHVLSAAQPEGTVHSRGLCQRLHVPDRRHPAHVLFHLDSRREQERRHPL